jgi:hypothetical protein
MAKGFEVLSNAIEVVARETNSTPREIIEALVGVAFDEEIAGCLLSDQRYGGLRS